MSLSHAIREIWSGTTNSAQRLRRAIKIGFLIILFGVIFWIVPVRDVFKALINANFGYMLLGIVLVFPVIFLGAVQLKILIRGLGISLTVWQILAINLTIKFYMLFMPNAFVGSGLRWYKFSKPDGKTAEALAAVAFNRLLDTFLVVILGLGFWLVSEETSMQNVGLLLLVVIIGTAGVWFILTRVSLPVYARFKAYFFRGHTSRIPQRLVEKTDQLLFAVSSYANFSAGELSLLITVGIVRNLINILSFSFLALSVGIILPYVEMGWIQSIVSITALLPFSIAEGLGYREVSLVAIMASFGISSDLALAFSFIIFSRTVVLGLVGGVIELIDALRVKVRA